MIIPERTFFLKDRKLLLRTPTEEDAPKMLAYLNQVCSETRFLLREPEETVLSLEQEHSFIRSQNASENSLILLGFLDGEYAGNCSLSGMSLMRCRHRAEIGIAILQKYTGMGIGTCMLQSLIDAAGEFGIEQLELEVSVENETAIALYEKMGFQIFGTLPNNMKYKDGTYTDVYWMMKKL